MQKNQRYQVLVAIENEPRSFVRRFGIDHAAEFDALISRAGCGDGDGLFLVGHNSNGPAANARVAAQQSLPVFGAVFFEFALVHDALNDFVHVVLLRRIRRENSVNFLGRMCGWRSRFVIEGRAGGMAEFVHQGADAFNARRIVRLAKVNRAADLRVHLRTAQFFRRSLLPDRSLD